MPDDDTHTTANSFDKEPATGALGQSDTNTSEAEPADLGHRIEPDAADERATSVPSTAPNPVQQSSVVLPAADDETLPHPGPGLLVLQWLVYALWGWTVLALSGLVALVIGNVVDSRNGGSGVSEWYGGGIAYLLAAIIVLYVIALICDVFYDRIGRKYARTTGTNVVMIIHAVIFALIGVGALISAVFSGVSMLIGDSPSTAGAVTGMLTGGIVFVIYGLTLLRTLQPRSIKRVAQLYWLAITIIAIIAVAGGIIGPAAQAKLRAQDQLIERELPDVARAVNDYAISNGKLPADLKETEYRSYDSDVDEQRIFELIEYKPGEQLSATKTMNVGSARLDDMRAKPVFHYQLCVEYKSSTGSDRSDDGYRSDNSRYPTMVSTYRHEAGDKCYDVQTSYSY